MKAPFSFEISFIVNVHADVKSHLFSRHQTRSRRPSRITQFPNLVIAMFSLKLTSSVLAATLLACAVVHAQNGPTPAGPVPTGTIKDCTYWDTATDKSYNCDYFEYNWALTHQQFVSYNPSVKSDCSGVIVGDSYCVEQNNGNPVTTSTSSQPSATTTAKPSPTQSGLTSNCVKFYQVMSGDTCQGIVDQYGTFTLSDFYGWNPAVQNDCSKLGAGYYVCVGVPGTPTFKPTSSSAATSAGPTPTQSGIVSNCKTYYKAVSGDDCNVIPAKFGTFTSQDFISWNPAVGSDCQHLFLGYYYCVGVPGTPTTRPTSTTKTSTTSAAPTGPSPTQSGITSSCNNYYKVVSGDTCQGIVDKYGTFSLSSFYSWNPSVGADCSHLFVGYYVCVGVPGTPKTRTTTSTSAAPKPTEACPKPQQPGTISSCTQCYLVPGGATCENIEKKFGITATQFNKWNPQVGSDCAHLFQGYYVCVKA
ncbi:hypothetical protein VTL71DRAFT_9240 [Oculimacula yallundae]|uniref:LysM domain-containing protein n=1 Tax=Oculimacula yallundae TaxID=86028 RepID=A0ABR4BSG6_9HELO